MMKKLLIIIAFTFALLPNKILLANVPHFLDFKLVLNESDAGKKVQQILKTELEKGVNNIKTKEKQIIEEEKKIIQQKKILSQEDYKKKLSALRDKVSKLQKERQTLLDSVAKQRNFARNELLRNLNPIIKEFMQEKQIRMVIDKKSLLLADENLDITQEIISRLNKKLKSIKLQ